MKIYTNKIDVRVYQLNIAHLHLLLELPPLNNNALTYTQQSLKTAVFDNIIYVQLNISHSNDTINVFLGRQPDIFAPLYDSRFESVPR